MRLCLPRTILNPNGIIVVYSCVFHSSVVAANMNRSTEKEIVTSFVENEELVSDGKRRTYSIYQRSKASCSKWIAFLNNIGLQNPCTCLYRCFGKGNSIVLKLYGEAMNSVLQSGGPIRSNFRTRILSDYEKAVLI